MVEHLKDIERLIKDICRRIITSPTSARCFEKASIQQLKNCRLESLFHLSVPNSCAGFPCVCDSIIVFLLSSCFCENQGKPSLQGTLEDRQAFKPAQKCKWYPWQGLKMCSAVYVMCHDNWTSNLHQHQPAMPHDAIVVLSSGRPRDVCRAAASAWTWDLQSKVHLPLS